MKVKRWLTNKVFKSTAETRCEAFTQARGCGCFSEKHQHTQSAIIESTSRPPTCKTMTNVIKFTFVSIHNVFQLKLITHGCDGQQFEEISTCESAMQITSGAFNAGDLRQTAADNGQHNDIKLERFFVKLPRITIKCCANTSSRDWRHW